MLRVFHRKTLTATASGVRQLIYKSRLTLNYKPQQQLRLYRAERMAPQTKDIYIDHETKTPFLDCKTAFDRLNAEEKLYTHYLAKASWVGDLISAVQCSAESPVLYVIFSQLFRLEGSVDAVKKLAKTAGSCDENEVKSLLLYAGAVFCNCGNYRSFGDTKFIPQLPKEKLSQIIAASKANEKSNKTFAEIWKLVADRTYEISNPRIYQLGFPPTGISSYFSYDCTAEDGSLIKEFMKDHKIEGWNTRAFKAKSVDGKKQTFHIRHASIDATGTGAMLDGTKLNDPIDFKGSQFVVTRGDYSPLLQLMVKYLKGASESAASQLEKDMLNRYVEHFTTGSLNSHKDGSRCWIKNKKPVVETYIGFIETYRDPCGQRAEFEGFVAVVDKDKSQRLQKLVDQAEPIIAQLPWPREYEKDKYLMPDFTELSVVAFSGGGMPIGINIPNYSDIRQDEGFKNVSLGNVIDAVLSSRPPQFLSKSDADLLDKYKHEILEISVAIHELLGHGTGKLFKREADGTFNFDKNNVKNIETGKVVTTWYEPGETYDSKFGDISSSYEECRAESVAIYLTLVAAQDVLKFWDIKFGTPKADDVIYGVWLAMAISGLKSLPFYVVDNSKWGQAHAQGRFAIFRVLEDAGLCRVDVTTNDKGEEDLLLTMDRAKIETVGKQAMGKFLCQLQLYKSMAEYDGAKKFYDSYTLFPAERKSQLTKWHEITTRKKLPRPLMGQPTTVLDKNGRDVKLKTYDATLEGIIQSYVDRSEADLENHVVQLYKQDEQFYKLT